MSQMSYHHTPLGRPLDGRLSHQILDTKAEQEPDTEAVIFYDMNMQRSSLTYAEYRDRSMHLAASLLQLGLSYGQRALLIGSSGLEYLISIMALQRIGAKAILMGPGDLTPNRVNLVITKNLDCRLIAYDPDMTDSQAKQIMTGIKELVQYNADCGRELQIIVTLKDQKYISKEQCCLTWNGSAFRTFQDLLKHGRSLDLTKLLETQQKVQIDDEIEAFLTSGSTGEPKIVQHTAHSLHHCPGMKTISGTKSRTNLYHDRPLCWSWGYFQAHAPLIESPLISSQLVTKENAVKGIYGKMAITQGVEVKIVDGENKIVLRGTPGEICTRSFTVFLEYLEDPQATRKAKTKTGWCYTGDIGCMDYQGKLEMLGRKSTIIKRLANKIFPSEIEKVIQQHPLVVEVKVVGIPDERLYEEVCACVILRQDIDDVCSDDRAKLQELEEWCEQQWPPRADGLSLKPKYFLSMMNFPSTASGKTFVPEVRNEAIKLLGHNN